jgi:hypothetical protein
MMNTFRAVADGMNWETLYYNSENCLLDYAALEIRLTTSMELLQDPDAEVTKDDYYEFLLALGNVSLVF